MFDEKNTDISYLDKYVISYNCDDCTNSFAHEACRTCEKARKKIEELKGCK